MGYCNPGIMLKEENPDCISLQNLWNYLCTYTSQKIGMLRKIYSVGVGLTPKSVDPSSIMEKFTPEKEWSITRVVWHLRFRVKYTRCHDVLPTGHLT